MKSCLASLTMLSAVLLAAPALADVFGLWRVQGAVSGSHVSWIHPTHYLFLSLQVSCAGTLAGSRIIGMVTVTGRQGNFTAARG